MSAVAIACRRRPSGHPDPRASIAGPYRADPWVPVARGAPASIYPREQLRLSLPDLVADALRAISGPFQALGKHPRHPHPCCARCFGLGRPLGAGALLAGEAPPHRAAPTAEHPATNPAAPCFPLQWITRVAVIIPGPNPRQNGHRNTGFGPLRRGAAAGKASPATFRRHPAPLCLGPPDLGSTHQIRSGIH